MPFRRNLPRWERVLRLAGGIGLSIIGAASPLPGWLSVLLAVSGVGLVLTAMAGFCPACALAGRTLPDRSK